MKSFVTSIFTLFSSEILFSGIFCLKKSVLLSDITGSSFCVSDDLFSCKSSKKSFSVSFFTKSFSTLEGLTI